MQKLLFLLLMLMASSANGQTKKLDALGFSGNIGFFANHKTTGSLGELSLFAKYDIYYATLCMQKFMDNEDRKLPIENYVLFGALLGKSFKNTGEKLIYSAGFGIVSGTTKGDFWYERYIPNTLLSGAYTKAYYYKETVLMPALLLKVESRFPLAQIIDFRTSIYANLTYKVPSFGFRLGFGFGKVRNKK